MSEIMSVIEPNPLFDINQTILTLTLMFAECAENHKGMQKIGSVARPGFTHEEMTSFYNNFKDRGFGTTLIDLSDHLDESRRNGDSS
jgi:hypothetical protein